MNLYLVEQKRTRGSHDDYGMSDGFVIAAHSSRTARKMANSAAGRYDPLDWTNPNDASCHSIGTAGSRITPGIVLESCQSE